MMDLAWNLIRPLLCQYLRIFIRVFEFVNSVVDSRVSSYLLGVLSCLSNLAPVLCIQILKIALFFKDFLKTVQRFPAD